MQKMTFHTAREWRSWLAQHHSASQGVWLIFWKKGSTQSSMDYHEAVEEALCYGWIDSIIKRLDEQRYMRKFTPRKSSSKWSELNKRRVEKLISEQRMTAAGMAKIKAAKVNHTWDQNLRPDLKIEMPPVFRMALDKNDTANANFSALAPGYQRQFITWILVAKRPETRYRRVEESIKLLEAGQKLGLK